MNNTTLELSEKVNAYIEKVKKETGYDVLIEGFPCETPRVALDHKCKCIRVQINDGEYKKESEEEIDFTIAHEVTHGFIALKKEYCLIESVNCGPEEGYAIFCLQTMIEDIVVDKIIYEKKYISYTHLDNIKENMKILRDKGKGEYFCEKYNDLKHKSKMILTYILAWGYLTYSILDKIDKKTLSEYLKIFQKLCPKHYEEAKKIKEIILKNDIFTSEGYNKTIKECLELWNLKDLVDVYICVKKNGHYDIISI